MKKIIKNIFAFFNIAIRSKSKLDKKLTNSVPMNKWEHDIKFAIQIGPHLGPDFLKLMKLSKAQFRQDLFALKELRQKKNGFFVEFGATDGVSGSNTFLLEKKFGYKGILAEPNPKQRKNIEKKRDAIIVEECVWAKSNENVKLTNEGDLSTVDLFGYNKSSFTVKTISLTDMLDRHNAPSLIDYLSIDTEGSEFDILSNHDFSKYKFSVITVEHNYTDQREKINKLLSENGYLRKYEELSMQDDWYILS